MRKIFSCSLLFLLLFQNLIYSQNTLTALEAGVKITKEFTGGKNDGSAIGLQIVYRLTNHSALETGVNYKANPKKHLSPQGLSPQSRPLFSPVTEIEKTILIPIAYRYECQLINIAVGTGVNFLLNKNQLEVTNSIEKTDWQGNEVELVAGIALSKRLRLNRTLYVEPEIKQCVYSSGGGTGLQITLSFRKRFL